jgi:sec-independent protein translocase protein TatA
VGVSVWQILIILLVVLLFFGPQRLPGLGKSIGEAIRGFKKGLDDNEIDVTASSEKLKGEGAKSEQANSESNKDKV